MMPEHEPAPESGGQAALHGPALLVGVGVMVVGSLWPLVFADAQGKADHALLLVLMWAMAAGLVRGVGFIPHHPLPRGLLSGWACTVALLLYLLLRYGPGA